MQNLRLNSIRTLIMMARVSEDDQARKWYLKRAKKELKKLQTEVIESQTMLLKAA